MSREGFFGYDNAEVDPAGGNVEFSNPYVDPNPPPNVESSLSSYPSFSSPANPGLTSTVDGIRVTLDDFMLRMGHVGKDPLQLLEMSRPDPAGPVHRNREAPHLVPYNDPRHPYRPFDPNIERPIGSPALDNLNALLAALPQNTEQPLTPGQANIVHNAKELALLKLMLHKECRDYVGPGAFEKLQELWNKKQFTYFNGVQFSAEEAGEKGEDEQVAATRGGLFDNRTPIVNFYNHRIVLGFLFFQPNVGGYTSSQNISTLAAQAQVILHELRHYITGIGHPIGAKNSDPESSASWQKNLHDKCNFADKK